MGTNVKPGSRLNTLIEELFRHRSLLVGIYLVVLVLCAGLFWYGSIVAFPEVFARLAGVYNIFQPEDDPDRIRTLAAMTGFLILQLVFIWGGGRIRLSNQPVRFRRVVVSIVIVAAMMSLLSVGFVFSIAEMLNRFAEDPAHPGGGLENLLAGSAFAGLLGGSWLLWMLIGLTVVRGASHHTALSRLISVVLAGSWIEFTVALPIDLVTRERNKDCVCASGSWVALIVCIPILVWSIGPAIYLLYRRERVLAKDDHRRPLRIMLGKSLRKAARLGQ